MNIPWRDAAFPAAFVVHVDIAREIILGFFIIRNARVVVMDFDAYRILLSVFCGSIPVVGCWFGSVGGWSWLEQLERFGAWFVGACFDCFIRALLLNS